MSNTTMRYLAHIHDAITRLGFGIAGALLGVIALSFCYEVVSRYFLGSPTEWASPLVSYAMLVMIFLAFPEMSRNAAHISINILVETVAASTAIKMMRAARAVAAFACLLAAWFCFKESLNQFDADIWTNPPFALPKWVISIFIPYGLLSSALYFVRQSVNPSGVPLHGGGSLT